MRERERRIAWHVSFEFRRRTDERNTIGTLQYFQPDISICIKRGEYKTREIYICIIWKRVVAENDNRKSLGDQSLSCVCDVTNDNDNNNNWKEFEKEKSLFPCNKDIVFFRSFVWIQVVSCIMDASPWIQQCRAACKTISRSTAAGASEPSMCDGEIRRCSNWRKRGSRENKKDQLSQTTTLLWHTIASSSSSSSSSS